ncbi:hypothetical protein [Heyndrickxia oleronia]|nr:hypothetical protein [Heyndrickxia oleronia]MBU5215096.1 hypothetical protein [Heyndrickxia oleronia]
MKKMLIRLGLITALILTVSTSVSAATVEPQGCSLNGPPRWCEGAQ